MFFTVESTFSNVITVESLEPTLEFFADFTASIYIYRFRITDILNTPRLDIVDIYCGSIAEAVATVLK